MNKIFKLLIITTFILLPASVHAKQKDHPENQMQNMTMKCSKDKQCSMSDNMKSMHTNMEMMMKKMNSMMKEMKQPIMKKQMEEMHKNMGAMMKKMQNMHQHMSGKFGMMMKRKVDEKEKNDTHKGHQH